MRAARRYQPTIQTATLPAPMGGWNAVDAASELPPSDCLALYNMVARERGLGTRLGYKDHVTGLPSEVRSLLTFRGSKADGSEDRLFACVQTGIYDATSSTATPTLLYTWPVSDSGSGWCTSNAFVNDAGAHFLAITDETNGYVVYDEATHSFTAPVMGAGAGEIANIDPTKLAFVTVWKNRIWFAEKDSANGWYLPIRALYGAATAFRFGTKFQRGGYLVGLWGFSIDGGAGIDDFLVAVSSGGDMAIYQGYDPSDSALFALKSVWDIGSPPVGRRIATDYGGDVLILSTLGLLPVSRILTGANTADTDLYRSKKISPVLGRVLAQRQLIRGWEVVQHPQDRTIVVNAPTAQGDADEQFVMALNASSWSWHQGVPMLCSAPWKGKLYFGTPDGRVCTNEGDADNVGIASTTNAIAIDWSLLSSFNTLGNAQWKQVQEIRPRFMTAGSRPSYEVAARYDYDLSGITEAPGYVAPDAGAWGTGAWGIALWGAGIGTAGSISGTTGCGTAVAIAIRGRSTSQVTLANIEVAYTVGGFS